MRKSTLIILVAVLVLFSVLNNTRILYPPNTVADPDLKLRGRGGEGILFCLPCRLFLLLWFLLFSFKVRLGRGEAGLPDLSPRPANEIYMYKSSVQPCEEA